MAATKKPAIEKTATVKATVENVETVKKEETVKKAPAKKPVAKKTAAKKAELKTGLHIQFGEKSYSQEELVKIAKDVWKYDLKKKVSELTSIELYVKPEESAAYYVMNNEFTGSFYI